MGLFQVCVFEIEFDNDNLVWAFWQYSLKLALALIIVIRVCSYEAWIEVSYTQIIARWPRYDG